MSDSGIPGVDASTFLGLDQHHPEITPKAIAAALTGFAVPMATDKDMEWLALAVRRSLAISGLGASEGPYRTSNAEIRAELERLAKSVNSVWLNLYERSPEAENALWFHAARSWSGDLFEAAKDLSFGPTRMQKVIDELGWLADFVQSTASAIESQRGPWRQTEEKQIRVMRAQYLAPVYEAAFGKPVSANNFPTDARIKKQTPFMDFYERIVTMAFGPRETANLTEVVKASCQLHRRQPVRFSPGIIPDL